MWTPLQQAVVFSEGGTPALDGTPSELWTRVLMGRDPDKGLGLLQAHGVIAETFPEIQAMVGFGGQDQGHKDLWDHTLKVVRQSKNRPAIRWAALWHDVGKPVSFSRESGKITFYQHEYASARLCKEALQRTGFLDKDLREKVPALVRDLGLLEGYSHEWTDSAVRRLHKQLGDRFEEVLLLARADVTSKHAHKRERIQNLMHELGERAKAIAAADAIVKPLPKGLGDALMAAFNIPPSKRLGDLVKALEKAIEDGHLEGHKDIQFYVDYLSSNRSGFGL